MGKERAYWAVTVGRDQATCPQCGSETSTTHVASRWERFIGWLVDRHVAPVTQTCPSGHSWGSQSTRLIGMNAPRYWNAPARLLRVVLEARRAEPNPLTYLLAAVLGSGLGLVLDWWLGWSWWLVAVSFVVLVWALFMASAFSRHGRGDLWVDLVRQINPPRGEVMHYRKLAGSAARASLTIYGLPPTWKGDRSFGGHGFSDPIGLTHLELAHGQPMAPPYVLVESRAPGRHGLDDAKRFLSNRLWERDLMSPEFPTSEELHEWHERKRREFEATPEPPWHLLSITVSGRPHDFEARTEGDHWAAVGTLGETVVAIEVGGLAPDQVSLVTIEDFAPYGEGSIAQESRWRRPPAA